MINFILNGQPVNGLVEWQDTEICVNVFGDDTQTNIDQFTFVDDAAKILFKYLEDGLNGGVGITEGVPFEIIIDCEGVLNTISLFVDLSDESACFMKSDCKIIAPVKICESKETIQECLDATSFDYIRSLNINDFDSCCVDIPFIVEKIDDGLDLAFLAFATFVSLYQTVEAGTQVVKDIINLTVVQSFADIARGILKLIASLIFFATMLIYTVKLLEELLDYIYPPVRYHKGLKFLDMLKKAYAYCGYEFKYEGLDELECLTYLPSKPNRATLIDRVFSIETNVCVPLVDEQSITLGGFIGMVKKLLQTETYVKDGCVTMYPIINGRNFATSNWNMPRVLNQTVKYNSSDRKATNLLQFATDVKDGYTVLNYEGTAHQRRFYQPIVNNDKKVRLNGLNECNIPLALGNRKEGLTRIEEALKGLFKVLDGLLNIFGGNSSLVDSVTQRIGMLKVENPIHEVPKILALNSDGTIKQNHRSILSANALYIKYHDHFKQQGKVKDLKIPFCCSDFNEISCYKNFNDCEGRESEVKKIRWNISKNYATISYNYNEDYTNNITHIDVTPQ